MFDQDFIDEIRAVPKRIENGIRDLQPAVAQLLMLIRIAVGALVVCAASLVWIATK